MEERRAGGKERIVWPGPSPEIPDIILEKVDLGGVKVWAGSAEKGFKYFRDRMMPKKPCKHK